MPDSEGTEREALIAAIHAGNRYDYDECDHGTYSGGASHGEPYAMCERMANRLIAAGWTRRLSEVHLHVSTHPDMEVRAELINEGYELAMAQHLADDPTAAQDWLDERDAEIRHEQRVVTTEHARKHYEQVFTGLVSMSEAMRTQWLHYWINSNGVHRAMLESDAINDGLEAEL